MSSTSFPTAIDATPVVEDTHLQLPLIAGAVNAIETAIGIGAKVGAAIIGSGAINIGDGKIRHIGALTGNVTLTLGTTGATAGDKILFVRTGTTAHTVAVGSLYTMPASQTSVVEIEYTGSAWALVHVYPGATAATLAGAETLQNKRIVTRQGADITGDITVNVADGTQFRVIPAAGTTITLGVVGVAAGDTMIFTKDGTEAFTTDVGGLFTIPSGVSGRVSVEYIGSGWRLVSVNLKPVTSTVGAVAFVAPVAGATVTLTGDVTRVGAHALTLTTTNATGVTLPTTGTLATLAGAETLSSKRVQRVQGTIVWAGNAATVAVTDGGDFDIPTTAAGSTLTLSATGAVLGDRISVSANGTANGHSVTIQDDNGAPLTLMTMTASKHAGAEFRFNGSRFRLLSSYQEA